jgi:hypothetical protein
LGIRPRNASLFAFTCYTVTGNRWLGESHRRMDRAHSREGIGHWLHQLHAPLSLEEPTLDIGAGRKPSKIDYAHVRKGTRIACSSLSIDDTSVIRNSRWLVGGSDRSVTSNTHTSLQPHFTYTDLVKIQYVDIIQHGWKTWHMPQQMVWQYHLVPSPKQPHLPLRDIKS